jgi:hypothetical protein
MRQAPTDSAFVNTIHANAAATFRCALNPPLKSYSVNVTATWAILRHCGVDIGKREGKTMASDDKKAKSDPAPNPAPKNEAAAKTKSTSSADVPKADGGETAAAAPSNYSRGEGQKPVTTAYKENWNAIFAKKNAKKKKR